MVGDECATRRPTAVLRAKLNLDVAFRPPGTDVECRLAAAWQKALNVTGIGLDDDFFELGGDSLAATELAAAVSSEFDAPFQPSMVFRFPTVAAMARRVADGADDGLPEHIVRINDCEDGIPVFVIHGRFGVSMPDRRFFDGIAEGRPVYMVQAIGLRGEGKLPETVEAIAAEYRKSIRQVAGRQPFHLVSLCAGSHIAMEMAVQDEREGEDLASLTLVDPPVPKALRSAAFLQNVSDARRRLGMRFRQAALMFSRGQFGWPSPALRNISVDRLERNLSRHAPRVERFGISMERLDIQDIVNTLETLQEALRTWKPKVYDKPVAIVISSQRDKLQRRRSIDHVWPDMLPRATYLRGADRHNDMFSAHADITAKSVLAHLQAAEGIGRGLPLQSL